MEYKGYQGHVVYVEEAKILHGTVLGIKDVITFQADVPGEVEKAFHDSVDDYLEWCEELGEEPDRTYSGRFNLRIKPNLHKELAVGAQKKGRSLNAHIEHLLEEHTQHCIT